MYHSKPAKIQQENKKSEKQDRGKMKRIKI